MADLRQAVGWVFYVIALALGFVGLVIMYLAVTCEQLGDHFCE